MPKRFQLVDVFNDTPFSGNPLGVVTSADDLSTESMQRITRWLNLSETAFLLKPTVAEADYRVRIFTLQRELPFAGHPTLGSCHAWLTEGGVPRHAAEIVQECGAGLIRIGVDKGALSFAAPPVVRSGPVDAALASEIAGFLGIEQTEMVDLRWADNGPGWVAVLLKSADAVRNLKPPKHFHRRLDLGVVGPSASGDPVAFEIRAFFTDHLNGIIEDPVTGSLNASVAQWLIGTGRAQPPYLVAQGTCLGRHGRVRITIDETNQVWVGGKTETLFAGEAMF
jgi:PhzF family phenazine biosynthesis protein